MTRKCICQMCACGKHRCPHVMPEQRKNIISKDPGQCTVSSEYDGNFVPGQNKRGPFLKPIDQLQPGGERLFETTAKRFHGPFSVTRPKRKEKENWKKDETAMDLNSEHSSKFVPLGGIPARPASKFKHKTQPFGVSTRETPVGTVTGAEFCQKPIDRTGLMDPPPANIAIPTDPFEQTSIHAKDYVNFRKPRSAIRKQPDQISSSKDTFEASTSNLTDFIQHNQLPSITKKVETYEPPTQPFDSTSLMRASYHGLSGNRADLATWNNHLFQSADSIDATTTSNIEFSAKTLPSKPPKKRENYVVPEGRMEAMTTSRDLRNFGSEAVPSRSARPKTTIRLGSATFRSDTHSKDVHRHFKSAPARDTNARDPRMATLTMKTDFLNNYVSESKGTYTTLREKPSSYRVIDNPIFPQDNLSATTSYGQDFSKKELNCPSKSIIEQNFDGVPFRDDFEAGHRYFNAQPVF